VVGLIRPISYQVPKKAESEGNPSRGNIQQKTRVLGAGETEDDYYQPLEKAELVRSGADVTILCYSRMRYVVMQAVQQLEGMGYDPEVRPPRLARGYSPLPPWHFVGAELIMQSRVGSVSATFD